MKELDDDKTRMASKTDNRSNQNSVSNHQVDNSNKTRVVLPGKSDRSSDKTQFKPSRVSGNSKPTHTSKDNKNRNHNSLNPASNNTLKQNRSEKER